MKKKSLQERWDEETLTDNSKVENCKQCKDCIFCGNSVNAGTMAEWSNHYTKVYCMIYKRNVTNGKPLRIITNTGICEYYNNEEDAED